MSIQVTDDQRPHSHVRLVEMTDQVDGDDGAAGFPADPAPEFRRA
jgi:hypothetical protein